MVAMRKSDIPDFVRELLDVGAETWALDDRHWVIGDSDVDEDVKQKIYDICDRYGEYDHLVPDIAGYLISVGRRSKYVFDG